MWGGVGGRASFQVVFASLTTTNCNRTRHFRGRYYNTVSEQTYFFSKPFTMFYILFVSIIFLLQHRLCYFSLFVYMYNNNRYMKTNKFYSFMIHQQLVLWSFIAVKLEYVLFRLPHGLKQYNFFSHAVVARCLKRTFIN